MTTLHEAAMRMALKALNKCIGRHYDLAKDASIGDAIEALRSALEQQGEQHVSGWKLVPVEPTFAMCIAGDNARFNVDDPNRTPSIYRAMLEAAPAAQQGEPVANPYPEGSPREAWRRGYNGETNFGAKGSDYDRQYQEGKRARTAAPAAQPIMETYIKDHKTQPLTPEQIIQWAREAGFAYFWSEAAGEALERFAELVAKHEREQCAKVCEDDAFVEQWKGLAEAAKRIRARGNV